MKRTVEMGRSGSLRRTGLVGTRGRGDQFGKKVGVERERNTGKQKAPLPVEAGRRKILGFRRRLRPSVPEPASFGCRIIGKGHSLIRQRCEPCNRGTDDPAPKGGNL